MGVKKAARKKVQRMKQPGAPVITITEFEETEVREGIPGRDEPDFTGQRKGNTMLRDDRAGGEGRRQAARNVLGEVLEICSITPMTGFYRDGCCNTGREDMGSHTVCALMTAAFWNFPNRAAMIFRRRCLSLAFQG